MEIINSISPKNPKWEFPEPKEDAVLYYYYDPRTIAFKHNEEINLEGISVLYATQEHINDYRFRNRVVQIVASAQETENMRNLMDANDNDVENFIQNTMTYEDVCKNFEFIFDISSMDMNQWLTWKMIYDWEYRDYISHSNKMFHMQDNPGFDYDYESSEDEDIFYNGSGSESESEYDSC